MHLNFFHMRKELRAKLVVICGLCPRLPCDHYCLGVSCLEGRGVSQKENPQGREVTPQTPHEETQLLILE